MQRRRSTNNTAPRPPKAPSLPQRRFLDLLSRKLGYNDGQSFLKSWAGLDRRGVLVWTRRTVYLATEEAKKRLKAQQPAAASSATPGSSHQTQRRQTA